jgi:hypothetical protein
MISKSARPGGSYIKDKSILINKQSLVHLARLLCVETDTPRQASTR